ncbi:MAG TPA: ABC transporter ATP-binding protein [Acidimicrobiia bacterium]|nr:ABC transporter ATP-binding protein [Acidimicrobiia bacterium]
MPPLLAVEGLRVSINRAGDERVVVDGVDLTVDEGEALVLVGESASGKSLIACGVVDLLSPGAEVVGGRTVFEGQVLQDLADADWRRLVGMGIGVMLQDAIGSLYPMDLIGWQSGEVLGVHGEELSQEEVAERVHDAFGEVALPKRRMMGAYADEVSRGQAQRAMLAAALLSAPRLLIADEPLSGLDVTVAQQVLALIDDLRRKRGMGLLLVTHDMAVAASAADRVAVVYGGAIVEEGPVDEIFFRPKHPYTAGLLGSVPGLGLGRLRPIEGEAPDLFELPRGCSFANRCEYAVDRCRVETPRARSVGSVRVACHRAEDLSLVGVG